MEIFTSPREMQEWTMKRACGGASIGFVPTMGALHEGHLSLARRARQENDIFVASVFVNPTQFGPGEDYATYARPFERDCDLLRQAGCDALFAPSPQHMYPALSTSSHRDEVPHFDAHTHAPQTFVEVARLGEVWEGTVRPGHLRGVATIVTMLFNVTRPTRAYFGEKDYQQLKVIEHLVRDLLLPIEIVPCETVREDDGLALSSRNANMSPEERAAAPVLYRAMRAGIEVARNGQRSIESIGETMCAVFSQEPLAKIQYIAIVDAETLDQIPTLDGRPARILMAARIGHVRLIDNMAIN